MDFLEKIWIENLTNTALGISTANLSLQWKKALVSFFDELSARLTRFIDHFNQMASKKNIDFCWQLFKLGSPHPRTILSRNHDKMIISIIDKSIQIRTLKIDLASERTTQLLNIILEKTPFGTFSWRCLNDDCLVNPGLVMEKYLISFLSI